MIEGSGTTQTDRSIAVLYVDPDPTTRDRLTSDLESRDIVCEVDYASTADGLRTILEDATAVEYDCVVTEYDLEEADVCSLLADRRSNRLPIVVYTDGDETIASEAIGAGAAGYVPKGRDDSIDRLCEQLRTVTAVRTDADLEQYRTLVETVGDSMYILDEDGQIEMINDALAAALGSDRETIVGSQAQAFLTPTEATTGRDLLQEILADDDRQWGSFEISIDPADEESYLAETNIAPVVDDGSLTGSVGVIRDISDHKERERRIRKLHAGTRQLMAAAGTDEVAAVATDIAPTRSISRSTRSICTTTMPADSPPSP